MNYEERYKKALDRAKVWKNKSGMPKDKQGILDDIFPELAESEDERIRKALITFFQRFPIDSIENAGTNANEAIAWLEKQGLQNLANSAKICKDEPKFKVGDWVQYRAAKPFLVEEITEQGYINGDSCLPFEWENEIHLWSIQDAKDGDVLACNEEILLFKSYSVQGRISLYCWYNGQTNRFHSKEVTDKLLTTRNKICPATKEQRDILFHKMEEAGYEWDSQSKQILRIN